MRREPAVQEKIMNELPLGMDFGPYVLRADSGKQDFVLNSQEVRDMLIAQMKEELKYPKGQGQNRRLLFLAVMI